MSESRTILCVDDEIHILNCLNRVLRRDRYRILTATSGPEAMRLLCENTVDVVISDQRMPEQNGTVFLQNVKDKFPDVVRIILSGYADVNDILDAINTGEIFRFLVKPWNDDELRDTIRAGIVHHDRHATRRARPTTTAMQQMGFPVIAGHQIVRKLGQGSTGVVYLAQKLPDGNGEFCAIKVLKVTPQVAENRKYFIERFRREADAASRVDHPNVVTIAKYGVTKDAEHPTPYIVMEYIPGETLKQMINFGEIENLSLPQRLDIFRQIADALATINRHDILHRDIKPDNIIVDEHHQIKITDFGIARLPNSDLTLTREVFGTPNYLSPEAFLTAKVDQRSDIFSLGVLAYELLLGSRPFVADNLPMLALVVQTKRPVEPRLLDPTFPHALQKILAKMLKKNPRFRYQTADAVLQDLDSYLSDSFEIDPSLNAACEQDWSRRHASMVRM